MTAQEQQMIQSLADRINNTPLAEKDPEAEQFIQQALGRNTDALYILAQTTLVQQFALEQVQKQLADARVQLEEQRQQTQQPKHATSFLGNLLGLHDDTPPPQQNASPQYAPVPDYNQPGYGQQGRVSTSGGSSFSGPGSASPPPPYGQPQYGQPQYGQPQYAPPQSGGFLRSAMQTATGVAAGALAFQGIESLMHGFGGGGSNFSSGMGGGRPEEIVNNYYGDATPGDHKEGLSPDIEDRRHESAFENAVDSDDHNYKDGFLDSDADSADTNDVSDSNFDDNTGDSSAGFGDDDNS